MQRLQALQNPHFGSKIQIRKKHLKINSTNHLELFCAKNRSKKQQISEQRDHFENPPSCKNYWLCKILPLGKKPKFQKTSQNPLYKLLTVDLWKKPLKKRSNIREMRPF